MILTAFPTVTSSSQGDFIISDGYLYQYIGSDSHVIIPSGVTPTPTQTPNPTPSPTPISATTLATSVADSDFVIENGVWIRYRGSGGDIIVPDGVTEIGRQLFRMGPRINSVILPNSVTKLAEGAFQGAGLLREITLSTNLKEIGAMAFASCKSLTTINLPQSVTTIGRGAFQESGLTEITLPSSLREIGANAFGATNLKQIVIPDGVTFIGSTALAAGSQLTDITIPPSVTALEDMLGKVYYVYGEVRYYGNINPNLTIHGVPGSAAEKYAIDNKLKFNAISMPDAAVPTASPPSPVRQSFSELKTDFEKRWGVRLDFPDNDDLDVSIFATYEQFFSMIHRELHDAIVAHFRSRGQTLTIRFRNTGEHHGTYNHPSQTITIFGMLSINSAIFTHEYGHMVHYVLEDIYGSTRFRNEWTRLNAGIPYGITTSDNPDIFNIFVESHSAWGSFYSARNILEDVAHVFALFVDKAHLVRNEYEHYKDTNIWEKAMLLDRIAASSLRIGGAFFAAAPQTPSPWAADAVSRAFSGYGVLGSAESNLNLYQAPINRITFCAYLVNMLETVYEKKHGKPLIIHDQALGLGVYRLLDPKTGEYTILGRHNFSDVYPSISGVRRYGRHIDGRDIAIAAHYGIVSGVSPHRFDPYVNITREQAAVILHRAAVLLGLPDSGASAPTPADSASVSSWAMESVEYVLRNNIMSGTGNNNFSPKQTYSYEQAAVTLLRIYDSASQ
jgi:hypothetical protein